MLDAIEDRNVRGLRPLTPPAELKAALPLGAQRVERQRALAASAHAGNDHEPISRNIDVDVAQVVNASPADPDVVVI